ncbi:VanZ family protein [Arthrobacter livingstonensis]|uniref:VanZ family protein n=1 Tax=Arthrobacter livingstonensis TaxID=670078 RepID=A0A2V5L5F2_9MICC|nr:VanZ family protein [Arthrobacter livingstonensis]PYI65822.1 VanZ family protein [Arthrobacter livingstonensis]
MKPSRHHVTMVLAVLYFVALAAMVFWPSPVDRPVDGALMQVIAWLHSHGLPQWFIGYRKVEFAANILLFVPFGFIIAVRLHRIYWWVAVAAAAVVSGLIELTQAMLLPERVPAWSDIVANTSGALIGAVLVLTLRAVFTRSNKRADARQ